MSTVESRLSALGLTLPKAAAPVANYVPTVITGNLLIISGQLCFGLDGKLAPSHIGKLGGEELNYSSDIDLMFLYDYEGATRGKRGNSLANVEFFARVASEVVRLKLPFAYT